MTTGRKTKTGLLVLVAALLAWLASPIPSSAGGQEETGDATISVFVSILPQAFFVERIGGERVRVETMVTPGQSPHTFEPSPQQMARLAEAKLYFRIGVEFENSLMPRIESTMTSLEVVDCREGIRLRQMAAHGHDDEEDGEDHHHEGADPHIWLSVRNAVRIAATMRDALIRLDPAGRSDYERGYRELVEDLEALDRRIAAILAPVKGKPLFVFHPAFGYFADDYGLVQIAVETGGSEPSARQLAHLIEEAREEGVRVVFVQPQFSRQSAETVAAEIGGAVVPIDALARDYLGNLERMARAVEEGLR
ncbi:MAG: zinc ABC transporter substrate-binding protein [Spirochaetales bacterium]|nr:zinc ABC transporter substrate-binding protein [Spirochaetales bacterium]